MNKRGFLIKNYYFRAALYMKLIVNNVKYRGIQCDFGRLTNVLFVTPDSLSFAVQRDTDFFQYINYDRALKPGQKGVLNKAGFVLHKCNILSGMARIAGGNLFEKAALSGHSESGIRRRELSGLDSTRNSTINNNPQLPVRELGNLGYQAIRACLMIRINN